LKTKFRVAPIRRDELRTIVPLSDSTIYEMEKAGTFPRRFNLTARCVVWDYDEVHAWLQSKKEAQKPETHHPDVNKRKTRPVLAHR
jgi:prophage regulatory protein